MITLIVIGAIALATLGYWWWAKRRLLASLGTDFTKYNEGAFTEVVVDNADSRFRTVERLAVEVKSKSGQLVISVAADGVALHHINQNRMFSNKGPYYVSRRTTHWRPTGRRHLIRSLRGKNSWGFHSSNPGHGGGIREIGIAVLEYDTKRYPPVDIWDYTTIHSKQDRQLELSEPQIQAGPSLNGCQRCNLAIP